MTLIYLLLLKEEVYFILMMLLKNVTEEHMLIIILIEPKVWRISFENSQDAVLLVLSSLEYNEEDYTRYYDEFEQLNCLKSKVI